MKAHEEAASSMCRCIHAVPEPPPSLLWCVLIPDTDVWVTCDPRTWKLPTHRPSSLSISSVDFDPVTEASLVRSEKKQSCSAWSRVKTFGVGRRLWLCIIPRPSPPRMRRQLSMKTSQLYKYYTFLLLSQLFLSMLWNRHCYRHTVWI